MVKSATALIVLLLTIFAVGLAENPLETPEELPIGFTEEELTRLDEIGINHVRTSPPPAGDIYNCSEWDPSQGVIIRYPFGISYAIIAEMSEDIIVYTIVASVSQQNTVTNLYNSNGVNLSNVEFIIAPTDSHWTRDYGPWFIFDGNGEFSLIDPVYNRPRPNDDAIPLEVAAHLGIPAYGMDLSTPGGNYMSDGIGMGISTTLVASENPGLTQSEIDSIINVYLGNDFTTYPDPLGEYIEHIDCWGKFLSPHTIMVLEVPTYHSQYDELNAAADYLGTLTSAWGQPYNIARVFSTGSQPYTNSIILNDKVLVPISSSSYDAAAIASYEAAMPGYEVLGFTGSWYNTDALHCRAMGVPDSGMLFLHHLPIFMVNDTLDNYELEVKIIDHSETGLIADSLKIYYRINDGSWMFSMLTAGIDPDMYEGSIPAQTFGTNIDYYIQSADNSGRLETHPVIGQPGAHTFNVVDATPSIALSQSLFEYQTYDDLNNTIVDMVEITNAGLMILNWSASSTAAWLTIDPSSGSAPSNLEFSINTALIPLGTWHGYINIVAPDAENSPQAVEIIVTVDPEIPVIVSTSPDDNDTDVQIDADISITFSIDMDPATITEGDFLIGTGGDVFYSAVVSYDAPSKTVTLAIDGEFSKSEHIFVQVSEHIESTEGQELSDNYNFDFWLEDNTEPDAAICITPENLAENVSIDADLCWAGSDPDGDSTYYRLYFGATNPPPSQAINYPDTVYELSQLDYSTQYFWQVITYDGYEYTVSPLWRFTTLANYICGDANDDGTVNVSDAVYIINYVFVGGEAPDPIESGEVNCDGSVNVSDAVYIINYVFVGGNNPCDSDGDTVPDC